MDLTQTALLLLIVVPIITAISAYIMGKEAGIRKTEEEYLADMRERAK